MMQSTSRLLSTSVDAFRSTACVMFQKCATFCSSMVPTTSQQKLSTMTIRERQMRAMPWARHRMTPLKMAVRQTCSEVLAETPWGSRSMSLSPAATTLQSQMKTNMAASHRWRRDSQSS